MTKNLNEVVGRKRTREPISREAALVGEKIRRKRMDRKWTLQHLAGLVGISQPALSKIEAGQINPDSPQGKRTVAEILKAIEPKSSDWLEIPIKARVAAGEAVEFFLEGEDTDSISVDPRMVHKKGTYYALRVVGESMEGAHVLTGDIVIVRSLSKDQRPRRNDLVVADIRAEGITLKRWQETQEEAVLIPANPKHEEIRRPRWRVKPVAVVVGVIRMMQ